MNEKFAVYFDCENVSANCVQYVLDKLEKTKGKKLLIKRAFRDWSKPNGWSQELVQEHGIEPMQVFTKNGKNSADIKITIDVMKELAKGVVDGIVLVSSDSDFSHLATEIRANGLEVFIFGDPQKMTERLKNSCDNFFFLPKSSSPKKADEKPTAKASKAPLQTPKSTAPATKSDSEIKEILTKALKSEYLRKKSDENGFCNGATIGTFLKDYHKVGLRADFGAISWKSLCVRFPDLLEFVSTGNKNSTLKIRLKK